jgi:aspartyl-tRNA(Asn)/glutamyl-tRNA(Gln) amidotransferase subunit A
MPAAYTGLVGMRPSLGRLARRYGFPPMAIDFQTIGPFARTMRDLRLLYDVLAGPDARDPFSARVPSPAVPDRPLRIGWFTAIGDEAATPEVAVSVAAAAAQLAALGHRVAPAEVPFDLAGLRAAWATLTAAGAARVCARFPDRWRADTTDAIRATAERGFALPANAYVDALDALAAWRGDVTARWGDWDALVMPSGAAPAWDAEAEAPPGLTPATQGVFCGWVNAAGMSGLSVPGAPHPDGRPIGVQIVVPFGADAVALQLGAQLEEASPWVDRWPALALRA